MRRMTVLAALMAFVLLAVFPVVANTAEAVDIVTVNVRVRDTETYEVMPNASVTLDDEYLTKTDANGNLMVITSAGEHELEVHKAGYERSTTTYDWQEDCGEVVHLAPQDEYQLDLTVFFVAALLIFAIVGGMLVFLTRGRRDPGKGIFGFAMVLVLVCMLGTAVTSIPNAEAAIGTEVTPVVMGLNDVGFLVSFDYSIEVQEIVESNDKWSFHTVERRITLNPTVSEPYLDGQRAAANPASVQWWDYEDKVGQYENVYVVGDNFARKEQTTFVDYKTTHLKETTSATFGSLSFTESRGPTNYEFSAGIMNFNPLPASSYRPLLGGVVGTTTAGGAQALVAIDPNVLAFDGFGEAFELKYGHNFESLDFIDEELVEFAGFTQGSGKTFLAQTGISGLKSGHAATMSSGIQTIHNHDMEAVEERLNSDIQDVNEMVQDDQDISYYDLSDTPRVCGVTFVIETLVSQGTSEHTQELGVVVPILIEPASERMRTDFPEYDDFGKKTYTNEDTLFDGWKDICDNSLTGTISVYVPFQRVFSVGSVVQVKVRGEGMEMHDRFMSDRLNKFTKGAALATTDDKWSFPVVRAVWNAIATTANWVSEKFGPDIYAWYVVDAVLVAYSSAFKHQSYRIV